MLTMHCTGIWASGLQAGGGEKDGLQKPGGWIYTQTGTVVQYLVTTETRPRALFLINERLSESAPPRNHAARRCAPLLSINQCRSSSQMVQRVRCELCVLDAPAPGLLVSNEVELEKVTSVPDCQASRMSAVS